MTAAGGGSRALHALAAWALVCGAACAREDGGAGTPARPPARPSVRFVCSEGCGSYKTVFPGERPPPCCGAPMDAAEPPEPAPGGGE
jgi:hypothetical protein